MTTPKVATIKRGGSRLYVHPNTREKVPGVTSVVGKLPKEFLKFWAAKVVAETAVENIGPLVGLAMRDPKGAVDYLKRSPQRNTGEAANTGTEVHSLVERMARGEDIGRVHPDLEGFTRGYQEFLDRFQPEFLHLEETVWSETHGYAGSFDAIARIQGEVVILDNKTTRSGVHAEVALQMAAYANADYLLDQDGNQTPLPKITAAGVVWLRPDEWNLTPVAIDGDVFSIFQALLQVYRWDTDLSKAVLGRPITEP